MEVFEGSCSCTDHFICKSAIGCVSNTKGCQANYPQLWNFAGTIRCSKQHQQRYRTAQTMLFVLDQRTKKQGLFAMTARTSFVKNMTMNARDKFIAR